MSGRARSSLRRALGIIACVFLCAAFTTIPGALGQSFPPIQNDASSDTSSDTQAIKSPLDNAGDLRSNPSDPSIQGGEAQQSSGGNPADSPLGEGATFTANISVGGVPTPCNFQVIDAGRRYVEIHAKYIGDPVVFKEVIPAIDPNAKGDVSIPTAVKNGNTVYTVTAVGDAAFYGCNIKTTGLAKQSSITSFKRYTYRNCKNLTDTGLAENTKITSVDFYAFAECTSLESTGLADNQTITSLQEGSFAACSKLISTGLETNRSITTIGEWAFDACNTLSETGLAGNTKVTNLGIGAFECCQGLISTGLADNDTLTSLSSQVFFHCRNLRSTGLEGNRTIKEIGLTYYDRGCFDGCTLLRTTGLEENTTVENVGFKTFANCSALTSTGLESNHTVSTIGKNCFTDCTSLGSKPDVTGATNTGDLVLNQPIANGKPVPLKIGSNAFQNTGYTSLYPRGGKDMLAPVSDAFSGSHIHTMYVEKSWTGTSTYNVGGLNLSSANGTLIVMAPKLTGLKASRIAGTSDSALLSFTTNHGFKTNISKTDNTSLGDYQVSLPATETGQMQEATCTIPTGAGLTPGPEELKASIDKFIYPLDAKAQDYNSLPGTSLSCTLNPVTYTIHFDAHGGSGTMSDQQVTYGRGDLLHLCTFSVTNMNFRHWSTDAQDKGPTNASYDNEALTDGISPQQGVTLTLFAQWELGLQVLSTHINSDPLSGVSYELSKTDQEPIQPLEGLSSDPEGQNPIHKEGEEGTHWPLTSDAQGVISMYWLSEGTYYLFNIRVPAGYNAAPSPMKVEVSHKDGKAFVTVNGNEVSKYADATAHMSIAFVESPSLPTTGNLPAGLLQGVGALVLITLGGMALRRLRQRR